MTPIQYLLLIERHVFAVDYGNKMNPMADCIDEATAAHVAKAMGEIHSVAGAAFGFREWLGSFGAPGKGGQ